MQEHAEDCRLQHDPDFAQSLTWKLKKKIFSSWCNACLSPAALPVLHSHKLIPQATLLDLLTTNSPMTFTLAWKMTVLYLLCASNNGTDKNYVSQKDQTEIIHFSHGFYNMQLGFQT